MATKLQHRPAHAVVQFDGKLTWPASLDLVEMLDSAVADYHHDAVELVVTSPGGDTDALKHVLAAVREYQRAGVVFQTRALSYAASAAAVLACAGNVRTATEDAQFLFHSVRVRREDPLTAGAARAVANQARHADDWLVDELVVGALVTGSYPPREAWVQTGDQPILEAVWPVVAPKRKRRPATLEDAGDCGAPVFVPARFRALETSVLRLGLDAVWSSTPEPRGSPSALRVCAWLGAVLAEGALNRVLALRYSQRGESLPSGALA